MKHHIIVKWTEEVTDQPALAVEVAALYASAGEIPGVSHAEIIPNVINRPNRYDLMIVVHMEKNALSAWDSSDLHHHWKDKYGRLVAAKTIFDCE